MLKLFSSGSSSLMRTFLLVGLILGSLGIALASQQLAPVNVRAAATLSKHDGYAPDVSIKIASSIDQETVTYTLTIRNAADGGIIRNRIPILFTDIIPKGLSNIRVTGEYWDTQVRTTVRPMITGRYRGNYPVPANTTLPVITITATITSDAGDMLTNSASVHVQGNRDRGHNQAVVHDNITSTSPSAPSPNSDNSTCNDQTDNSPCEQRSLHISVRRRVRISAQESIDTSDQQNTSASSDTPNSSSNTSPNLSPNRNPGKGSTDPFPALPNTGSGPLLT